MSETPSADELQFERAQIAPAASNAPSCADCKQTIADTYFHASGAVVCPTCAELIQTGQQAPPTASLGKAALWGGGASLAGCAIYAAVALITGLEIGLIAILVGVMVGTAIRRASGGRGGRPQQILAVVLTYFAITTSYIPLFIKGAMENKPKAEQTSAATAAKSESDMSVGMAVAALIGLAAAAPFLTLTDGSGILSLAIIGFGLFRAWKLTGRTEIVVMGPYSTST